jgi:signal transduction histidine kinase
MRSSREEIARQYLTWIRVVVPAIATLALFMISFSSSGDGVCGAAIVALLSTAAGAAMALAGRRFGFELLARVSIYVDLALIAWFVTRFEDISVYGVTFMWAVVVAAVFGTPRDTVIATALSVALAATLPELVGDPDRQQVAVEALMLGIVGMMVAALGLDGHRAARERRSLEQQLEDAQRLAQIGSFDFDPVTDEARWSDQMHRIFLVPDGVPLGNDAFLEAIVPEERARVAAAMQSGLAAGSMIAFDTTIRRGDGELRSVHVIGTPMGTDAGLRVVGTVQDVTELRRLDSMRDEFVAAASHELRTPTSIVLGFASTLTNEWDRLPEGDRRRFVGEIEDAAMRLSLLIEDVLQVSQIESGNVHCQREPFDLRAEVLDLVRTWPGSSTVELDDASTHEPVHALGDATRTRQVLVNLLENAERHATDADRPVHIRVGRAGRNVEAVVTDHGPGIPPEAHARIFDRFVRLRHDSTGTGLGLYISRRLAEAQGGTLDVESSPGHGAAFTFVLPADPGTSPA